MKRILIPVSFSRSSENSIFHASLLFPKSHLNLAHIYPTQTYNRLFEFGETDYQKGVLDKLKTFYKTHAQVDAKNTTFISQSGVVSEFVANKSHLYDLLIMTRKPHVSKTHGYLSEKKLYITTRAKCPVLILPIRKEAFKFEECEHVWHIKRDTSETSYVKEWNTKFAIDPKIVEEKSLAQSNFISAFWQNIVQYENTHNSKLLKVIDTAHDSEPIDLIIMVDNERSLFTKFFMSDTVKLFCKYDIPILVLPPRQ